MLLASVLCASELRDVADVGGSVKQRRSCLALVAFCATTAFVASLALAIVFVSATAAYALAAAFTPDNVVQEFSGVLSDSHCVGRHMMQDKSVEDCVRTCIQQGSKYVLVDGEHVYTLDGDISRFTTLAGERVTVAGVLDGTNIKVSAINPIRPSPPGA